MFEALAAAGIEVVQRSNGASLGVLWLDGSLEPAAELVEHLHRGGATRIVVAVPPSHELASAGVWRLVRAGAADVITWDGDGARGVVSRLERWAAVDALLEGPVVKGRIVGDGAAFRCVLRDLVEAAVFSDSSVLLAGESGVGKEEAARLVHALDPRRSERELVVVDCTTVVPELAGSEFFGHERGAFTGAQNARDGAFALADGGTLFLDEVGELPPPLQAQLLRVIQERTFKRVGSNIWARTDFRLVCATNRDLTADVEAGRFRRDLYHRIAAHQCRLPSLRERPDDILPLALHFLREVLPPDAAPRFDRASQERLLTRKYPGNVRELRQLVRRIGKRHVGPGPVTVGDLPLEELAGSETLGGWPNAALDEAVGRALAAGVGLREIGIEATEAAIRLALRDADGNLQRAAQRLGVTDRALQIRRARRHAAE